MNLAFVLKVKRNEGDGLTIVNSTTGLTTNVKFDGRDHPDEGSGAPKGLTSSARRVDPHTMEIADKVNGKPLSTRLMTLSSDLKTLTIALRTGRREPNILVLERQ